MAKARATTEARGPKLSGPVVVLRGMAWRQNGTQIAVTCPDGHDAQYNARTQVVACECGFESEVVLDGLE